MSGVSHYCFVGESIEHCMILHWKHYPLSGLLWEAHGLMLRRNHETIYFADLPLSQE